MTHRGQSFTLSKIITTFTQVQQSEALQHTWRSYTYTYKHSFDHMLAHMSILIIGSQVQSTPYVLLLTQALPRRFLQDSRVNTLKFKLRTTIVQANS